MRKLTLDPDTLRVESFETVDAHAARRGTVPAFAAGIITVDDVVMRPGGTGETVCTCPTGCAGDTCFSCPTDCPESCLTCPTGCGGRTCDVSCPDCPTLPTGDRVICCPPAA